MTPPRPDPPGGPLLVVSHEATRTGAPRVLLDLLRYVRADLPMALRVRLESGGPLADELLALDDAAGHGAPAAVLVNSALAADVMWEMQELPAAIYLHEDRDAFAVLSPDTRKAIATFYDRVLCVSEQGRADAIAIGVDPDRIRIVPPLVNAPTRPGPRAVAAAREALGATDGDTVVLGCGEGGWRKGADLFVEVAHQLAGEPRVRFAWVGLRPLPFARHLEHTVATAGLGDRVRWIDEVPDPQAFLVAADLVVVTSRSDPQPLVPIEAALGGTATAGFAIGGMVDLAAVGAAATVPYPDIAALAATILELRDDEVRRDGLAAAASARWHDRQAPAAVAPCFLGAIDHLVAAAATSEE